MATWNLDPTHSEVDFKVKHMMISTVKGAFTNFEVTVNGLTETLEDASITAKLHTTSIDTKNQQRDEHLKGSDFFNATHYPSIDFHSSQVEKLSTDEFRVTGDLTIKDVTRPVILSAEFGGIATDPWGNQKAGYTVTGKINRSDFGLNWNAALETGGVMVSEEVRFQADLQFVLSKDEHDA